MTIAVNAHYDGKVIVPDEPLNLPPNQKVRIQVEPINGDAPITRPRTDWRSLIGIARGGNDRPYDPADEDALWEKGPFPVRDEGRDR